MGFNFAAFLAGITPKIIPMLIETAREIIIDQREKTGGIPTIFPMTIPRSIPEIIRIIPPHPVRITASRRNCIRIFLSAAPIAFLIPISFVLFNNTYKHNIHNSYSPYKKGNSCNEDYKNIKSCKNTVKRWSSVRKSSHFV